MRPQVIVAIEGQPVAGLFYERLISLTMTDKEGVTSDTIKLDIEDGSPFMAVPRIGASITATLGYIGAGPKVSGLYKANDVSLTLFPHKLSISGKAADMRTEMKQHREKNWDNTAPKDIWSEIAGKYGLSARIAPGIGQVVQEWTPQMGESDIHFAERLARRNGGLLTIKNGQMIVADKSTGLNAAGVAMTGLVIVPQMVRPGSFSVKFKERGRYKQVKASYHDTKRGERVTVKAPSDKKGNAVLTLREPFGSKAEAQAAAKSRGKELASDVDSISGTLEGTPFARAGAQCTCVGLHPILSGLTFILETVTHSFTKSGGFTTKITAKVKPS